MRRDEEPPALREVLDRLLRSRLAAAEDIQGCSPDEIRQLEADAGVPLPNSYRRFLAVMGRGAGGFLVGSEVFFPHVLGLRAAAEALLADGGAGPLPDDALVFLMHQGYQFSYMLAGTGEEDPPVYHYLEEDPAPELKWPSFSAFLLGCLQDEIALRAR